MIRWCAYCQRYQGEVEPFDDYAMTHTICDLCVAQEAFRKQQPQELESIRRFFLRVAGIAADRAPSAAELVAEGAALGLDPVDLLLGIVQPVLHQIGDRWARSQVTIAEEHRVTAVCSSVILSILQAEAIPAAVRRARQPTVLLVSADGNDHTLGIQILEVFLVRNQIPTVTIYPGLPSQEIVSLARSLVPRVVGISAAMPEQVQAALSVAEGLADLPPATRPLVVVGGLALRSGSSLPAGSQLHTCRDLQAFLELARSASSGENQAVVS